MVKAVRGMRDILPEQTRRWHQVERSILATLASHAFEEIRLPLLEYTELFARGVGEATDIVEKEMYTLADRDGDSLSLRPEGTASCVRALQEHGLLYNQTQRVHYSGPMFRYEKPQKGRYRQFYQIGAEAYGFAGPDMDAELLLLAWDCWHALGIQDRLRLEINTLGSSKDRAAYRDALVAYLEPIQGQLDEDSQRRLLTNPMRILDSKKPETQALLEGAPRLPDFVDAESREHFEKLQQLLDQVGIPYRVNANLVRGLDYYTRTVFEWLTDDLGAQGAVCAGGRYDGLVERLGGRPTPAVGFAVGLDRVVLLHELAEPKTAFAPADIYICVLDESLMGTAMALSQRLRSHLEGQRIRINIGGGALKKQMKRADAAQANWAILLGDDERDLGSLTLKHLRNAEFGQQRLVWQQALDQLND